MDGRIMKWGLMLLLCIPFWTACNNDDVPEAAIEPQKDCEVSVSIRLNAKSLRAMGDPGEEVDEFDSQYWTRIDIFLVYSWGQVLQYTLDKDYKSGEMRKFTAFAGVVKAVYAVAYNDEVLVGHNFAPYSEQDILNLQTPSITSLDAADEKKYLLSLFSGMTDKTKEGQPIEVVKEGTTEIKVGLDRLAAKVDVQWDAQDAYEGDKYVEAKMSDITFRGTSQGYFFPGEKAVAEPALDHEAAYRMNSPISERNGRIYFYTFSGAKNYFNFVVKHRVAETPDEKETFYTATFANALERSSWHKVNLTVSGTTFEETTKELNLTQKTAANN